MTQLVDACRANDITDLIIVHEHRGEPGSLVEEGVGRRWGGGRGGRQEEGLGVVWGSGERGEAEREIKGEVEKGDG